jgi:hypothetical protein
MELPSCVNATRAAYASDAPLYADDAREYFESLSNEDLEEIIFQLTLDLKSIESQILASRARYFAGEQKDTDKTWYAKTKSVQAIKITQLMCADHEFDRRLKMARKAFKVSVKSTIKSEHSAEFLQHFFTNAKHYLKRDTFEALVVFTNGQEAGQETDIAHRYMLPNWSELIKPDLSDNI